MEKVDSDAVSVPAPVQKEDQLSKYKRLLTMARSSLEANQVSLSVCVCVCLCVCISMFLYVSSNAPSHQFITSAHLTIQPSYIYLSLKASLRRKDTEIEGLQVSVCVSSCIFGGCLLYGIEVYLHTE